MEATNTQQQQEAPVTPTAAELPSVSTVTTFLVAATRNTQPQPATAIALLTTVTSATGRSSKIPSTNSAPGTTLSRGIVTVPSNPSKKARRSSPK